VRWIVVSSASESNQAWAELSEAARRLAQLGRDMGAAATMFHSVVADKLGLSATDHKCLELASRAEGPVTAGRIAELSGLSTGAVTGVIDRLERAGYVRRVRDPHDRRKVLVEIANRDWDAALPLFDGLRRGMEKIASAYTPEELAIIGRYASECVVMMNEEATRLRDAAAVRPRVPSKRT
jgi:DNA-binding MarR family transcriptional regulator